jgi:hypothetical protein
VIPFEYDIKPWSFNRRGFYNGIAEVCKDGEEFYINDKNERVEPPKVEPPADDTPPDHFNGYRVIEVDGGYGFTNPDGEIIVQPEYNGFETFGTVGFFVKAYKGDKRGVIDIRSGEAVLPVEYSSIDYSNAWSITKKVNGEYRDVRYPCVLAKVEKDGKFGYINADFEVVVPCEYDFVGGFYEKYALVRKDGKCAILEVTCEVDDGEVLPFVDPKEQYYITYPQSGAKMFYGTHRNLRFCVDSEGRLNTSHA